VFLVSGNGGTLKFLQLAIDRLRLPFQITAVIADRDCGALTFARQQEEIQSERIRYRRTSPNELRTLLTSLQPDAVVTTFHRIIDPETLDLLPNRFVNLHYSLLPAFGGLIGMATLDAAKEARARFVGATCHRVDELVDHGQIISQAALAVDWDSVGTPALIPVVFRAACLCFLSGLETVLLGAQSTAGVTSLLGHDVWLNPGLGIDTSGLDEEFWTRVSSA
jgi:phosphoribosylglycinamide formyltransferase-1